jgi:hypothetical protein
MLEQELNRSWKRVVDTIQDGLMAVDRTWMIEDLRLPCHGVDKTRGRHRSVRSHRCVGSCATFSQYFQTVLIVSRRESKEWGLLMKELAPIL